MMRATGTKSPADPSSSGRLAKIVFGKTSAFAPFIGEVVSVWERLVSTFCEIIDPVITRFVPDARLVGIVTGADGIMLHHVDKNGVVALGALTELDEETKSRLVRKKMTAIELRLRPDQVLIRSLSLPGASRDFLGPIIENRLERLTPWRADKVLYGYQVVEGGSHAPNVVVVSLIAASKDIVGGLAAQMAEAGFPPARIGAGGDDPDKPMPVTINIKGATPTLAVSQRIVSRVALAVFGSLAIVAIVTATIASSAVDEQDAIGAKLVKARMLLKAALTSNVGDREKILLDAKVPAKATVVLIDKLATAIPDNTYLRELTVTPDKVRLAGSTSDAAALVGKLEAAGLVNVRFNAAVTREKDLRDSFEATADRFVTPAGNVNQ